MATPTNPWKWTNKRECAAQMVAADEISCTKIAKELSVSLRALHYWKTYPEFQARVAEHLALWRAKIRDEGLAVKWRRIQALAAEFDATAQIVRERGIDTAWMDDNGNLRPEGGPGGATGLIIRSYAAKYGDRPVFKFDAALMRTRLHLLKQIAQEVGEFPGKPEPPESAVNKDHMGETLGDFLTPEELMEIEEKIQRRREARVITDARPQPRRTGSAE